MKTAPCSPPDIHTHTESSHPLYTNYNYHDYNRKQHNEQTQERDHKNDDGLKLGYHHASLSWKLICRNVWALGAITFQRDFKIQEKCLDSFITSPDTFLWSYEQNTRNFTVLVPFLGVFINNTMRIFFRTEKHSGDHSKKKGLWIHVFQTWMSQFQDWRLIDVSCSKVISIQTYILMNIGNQNYTNLYFHMD